MSQTPPTEEIPDDDSIGIEVTAETADAVETLLAESREAISTADSYGIDTNQLFEVLSDPGCRYVLTYLLQSDGAVACNELVDYVVGRTETTMTRTQFRKRVVSKLTKEHLPKLDDHGLVQYNMERQMIGPTDITLMARPYLLLALAHQQIVQEEE